MNVTLNFAAEEEKLNIYQEVFLIGMKYSDYELHPLYLHTDGLFTDFLLVLNLFSAKTPIEQRIVLDRFFNHTVTPRTGITW